MSNLDIELTLALRLAYVFPSSYPSRCFLASQKDTFCEESCGPNVAATECMLWLSGLGIQYMAPLANRLPASSQPCFTLIKRGRGAVIHQLLDPHRPRFQMARLLPPPLCSKTLFAGKYLVKPVYCNASQVSRRHLVACRPSSVLIKLAIHKNENEFKYLFYDDSKNP